MNAAPVVAVCAGAAFGALLRWGLGVWLNPLSAVLPLGTLAANLVGGLLVGVASVFFTTHPSVPPEWRLLALTGFLGALTTFSTFSIEVVTMLQRQQYAWALGTALTHLAGSLLLTVVGIAIAQAWWTRAPGAG